SLMPPGKAATTGDGSPTDSDRSAAAVELQALRETVRQVGEQARRVTMGAMPLDFQEVGLREALQEAVERFRRMAPEVEARLEIGPFDVEPPPAVREAAYWIAVSALNNCREHARASEVRVFVSAEGSQVQMTIRDNGVGFQEAGELGSDSPPLHPRPPAPLHRLGLRNMRARATEVGADLQIESGSWGTAVHFSVALPKEQPIRMLVVEDSEAFVAGLRTALAKWAHEIEIVGVAASADQALALAETLWPDIVLLDLRIGESLETEETDARHGLRALLGLERMPQVRTVVMSFIRDPAWLRAVAQTGAWAFWNKDEDVATLVGLLRRWPPASVY
ncbi:MAG: response regulator, partial [Anaerolineae bacterium]